MEFPSLKGWLGEGGRTSRICLLLFHNRANFNPSLILLHFSPKDSSLPPQHYLTVTQLTTFMVRHRFTRQRGDLMASTSLHLLPVIIPKKLTAQAPQAHSWGQAHTVPATTGWCCCSCGSFSLPSLRAGKNPLS